METSWKDEIFKIKFVPIFLQDENYLKMEEKCGFWRIKWFIMDLKFFRQVIVLILMIHNHFVDTVFEILSAYHSQHRFKTV